MSRAVRELAVLFGPHTTTSVYVGIVALAVNLVVTLAGTPLLRLLRVPAGTDATRPEHYVADEGDARVQHMTDLIDGDQLVDPPGGQHRLPVR